MVDLRINRVFSGKIVKYLKKRILLNQRIIKLKYSESELINLEMFLRKYDRLKNGIDSIEEVDDPVRKELVNLLDELMEQYGDSVLLNEEEIYEILELINQLILKYGIACDQIQNENSFIKNLLGKELEEIRKKLGIKSEDNIEYQKINKWFSYFSSSDHMGFCKELCSKISINKITNDFIIESSDNQVIFKVNKFGRIIIDRIEQDEDFLISSDLYIGVLHKNDEDIATLFLKKNINGEKKLKAISYDDKLYSFEDSGLDNFVKYAKPVNQFFESKGFGFMTDFVYTKETFKKVIKAFNKGNSMTEEEKTKLDEILEIVAEWWSNAIEFSKVDIEQDGIIKTLNLKKQTINNRIVNKINHKMCTIISRYKRVSCEKELEKFKNILKNIIRKQLLICSDLTLSTVEMTDESLVYAAKKAGLDGVFPNKTIMWITPQGVSVKTNYAEDIEVLFNTEEKVYAKNYF